MEEIDIPATAPGPSLWEESHRVFASDTDFQGRGKLSYLLDLMQRAADSAVAAMGVPLEQLLEHGMGWMMTMLELEVWRSPKAGEELVVRTWSKGTKGPLWQRDYRIISETGEELVRARTLWVLVDIQKRKMLRPQALPVQVQHYTEESAGEMPVRRPAPEHLDWTEETVYLVRYSGLDHYGHLNNARYADLVCDTLPMEVFESREVRRFHIAYLNEAKGGAGVRVRYAAEASAFWFKGDTDHKAIFEAWLELK